MRVRSTKAPTRAAVSAPASAPLLGELPEQGRLGAGRLASPGLDAVVAAVGLLFPGLDVVGEVELERLLEDALAQLEQIVRKLEAGDVPLEDSIRIYERGAALKRHCEAKLREAQAKVSQIQLGPDGPTGLKDADIE